MSITVDDQHWMLEAIVEAKKAGAAGEVPVGAVLVADGHIIGRGYNQTITTHDPTAHAEIIALRQAAAAIENYRLINTTLYVTLEPCTMCAGAMIHSRIGRLVFGAPEPKAGAVISQVQSLDQAFLNHVIEYSGGVLQADCAKLLTDFFRHRRQQKALSKTQLQQRLEQQNQQQQ